MKLWIQNFTGVLPNGNRYKIVVTNTNGFINAYMYEEIEGIFWVDSVAQALWKEGYQSYLQALKKVLSALQNTYPIQLIKT
ncbi:hypothetical protein [Neptunitalea lumnitzerae]|uniref:Uncharacterized protein n=1 Tax=Neptunitalea lumnitzerae TaxID=2965509 RepID=A0ABQ5MEN7_9FLAO|nr:hypothetical protein [Neptunitalea sp. Y10]GLB47823.1 hypothetical protein Y10_01910 [Neptunitalea sp. Y10]